MKVRFFSVLLGLMILISPILLHNSTAQTYDTITKQREMFKDIPQIPIGSGYFQNVGGHPSIAINPTTNKIYVPNSDFNTVSVIDSNTGNITNIPVGLAPMGIAINPASDKIHVANSGSNTISVINGDVDKKEPNDIPVGKTPLFVYVLSNKIYVANSGSNTISVINGDVDKKEPNDIPVGNYPDIITGVEQVLNTGMTRTEDSIYVLGLSSLSVIANATSHKTTAVIPVGLLPTSIDYDSNNIYVANSHTSSPNITCQLTCGGTVSVVNGTNYKEIGVIPVGIVPYSIKFDHYDNGGSIYIDKIYVANFGSNSVSVINDASDKISKIKEITRIPVGRGPSFIEVSPSGDKIYVTDSLSDTVSVISAASDKEITRIPVGANSKAMVINPNYRDPNSYLIYVFNEMGAQYPNTISVIDGSIDKVAAGVTFNIHPASSGGVWCNNKEYPTNIYLYVASGTKCIARPTKGFEFSSWDENRHNSTIPLNQSSISDSPWTSFLSILGIKQNDTSATFDVNRYGTFTANFKQVPPSVPPEYWIPLYGIIVSTIVGWSIPSILGWIKSKTLIRRTTQYHKRIHSLYTDNGKLNENDKTLDILKTDIKNAYAEGKISEQHFNNLKDETSILYERAYRNKIDSLKGKE
jgi:YVTN family beta-propeller protein